MEQGYKIVDGKLIIEESYIPEGTSKETLYSNFQQYGVVVVDDSREPLKKQLEDITRDYHLLLMEVVKSQTGFIRGLEESNKPLHTMHKEDIKKLHKKHEVIMQFSKGFSGEIPTPTVAISKNPNNEV